MRTEQEREQENENRLRYNVKEGEDKRNEMTAVVEKKKKTKRTQRREK